MSNKIVVEIDSEELKHLVAGIVTERVMNILPVSSKREIAKNAAKVAQQRLADQIYEELSGA
jgi:hypothetical protein